MSSTDDGHRPDDTRPMGSSRAGDSTRPPVTHDDRAASDDAVARDDRVGHDDGWGTDDTAVQPRPVADPTPPRSSERPDSDPFGPGTTFFTNHPDDVVKREKDAYGGVKVGAAFFGWLSAVALLVLLLGLLSAAGALLGFATGASTAEDVVAGQDPATVGLVAGVVLLLVLFLAYLGGGYVAGRMARFDGLKQGLAVWLWALAVAVLAAVVGAVAGDRFDVLAQVDVFPRLPVDDGDVTTAGVVAGVLAVLATLGGALLGGAAGTRYHRKVDRVGLLPDPERAPAR